MRSNHYVAGDPTRIAGGEGQNQNSEQIESVLDSRGCTAESEDKSAAKIESDQQRIDNDLFVDDQLAYGDSQA